jgi:transcriptional regulator with XRE-family HTH domain
MSKTAQKRAALVGEILRNIRIKQELSQQALADMSGVDRKTVNRIENGHFSPNMETFLSLCEALVVQPRVFFK